MSHPPRPRRFSALRALLSGAAGGGIVLMGVAALALATANSPLGPAYTAVLGTYVGGLSVLHWINDGLMAVFFLLVGLEIKREFLHGELDTWPRRLLPGIAALGGMLVPALVYLAINRGPDGDLRGWAVPAATDIAFALGVLALLGSRVPVSLKVFLTALAIIDDLGAVAIIAAFYTGDLQPAYLAGAGLCLAGLAAFNVAGTRWLPVYLVLGLVLWFMTLKSGVHATLAGVALAFAIPANGRDHHESPLERLEHGLSGWVTYGVVPIFGFANAGVALGGSAGLLQPIPLGIALGLFVGKQIGVFGFAAAAIRLGVAGLPAKANWRQLYGTSVLCGIGFTMSLFIGLLAFPDDVGRQEATKIGVIAGSVASALLGALLLLRRPAGVGQGVSGTSLPL